MIVAVDVTYWDNGTATAAAIVFPAWESGDVVEKVVVQVDRVARYRPGSFYLRELPCITQVLHSVGRPFGAVVIDGFVVLGSERRDGLGMHLWRMLSGHVAVIGVAKSPFSGTPDEMKLFRGGSRRPLFITAAGISLEEARASIARMKGTHRIPDLLKEVDCLSRSTPPGS